MTVKLACDCERVCVVDDIAEMNASVEHFVTRCELACMMQELIGSYIMMEEYFMRQMVVKVCYLVLGHSGTSSVHREP